MKALKAHIVAAIVFAILAGSISVNQAQSQSANTNDITRHQAKREQRHAGFSLMPAGRGVNTGAPGFTITAGPNLQVLGSGTTGRLTKWTGLTGSNSFIGDSTIFEDKFGLVGIGTDTPTSKLTVAGVIETKGGGGIKFPDGTIQTTSTGNALFSVAHNATLIGNGALASPLGVATPLVLEGSQFGVTLFVYNAIGQAVFAKGGTLIAANSQGGQAGVAAEGGSSYGIAGPGVLATGGFLFGDNNGYSSGGVGVQAKGGHSFSDTVPGNGGSGVVAEGGVGFGAGFKGGNGVEATAGHGLAGGATDGFAGLFHGAVEVQGNFNVTGGGTKNFKIDHPLDPENKYLYHAAVESSEVLNIYSGNVMTDENGDAVVALPDWFEAINRDFRYQLTVIGTFAQAVVADEINRNRFKIKTNAPGVKVSWQVTGIRSDAAIRKHQFKLEEDKPQSEKGSYLAPEAYDQPEDRGVEWARNPRKMQELRQRRIDADQRVQHK